MLSKPNPVEVKVYTEFYQQGKSTPDYSIFQFSTLSPKYNGFNGVRVYIVPAKSLATPKKICGGKISYDHIGDRESGSLENSLEEQEKYQTIAISSMFGAFVNVKVDLSNLYFCESKKKLSEVYAPKRVEKVTNSSAPPQGSSATEPGKGSTEPKAKSNSSIISDNLDRVLKDSSLSPQEKAKRALAIIEGGKESSLEEEKKPTTPVLPPILKETVLSTLVVPPPGFVDPVRETNNLKLDMFARSQKLVQLFRKKNSPPIENWYYWVKDVLGVDKKVPK
jgi:hypothetical protein